MSEELTTYALVIGTVSDAVAAAPSTLRTNVSINLLGIGTPPSPTDALWARAYANDGFVIAADAATIRLDKPLSSDPDPKRLAGAFDVHFVISAAGYADSAQTVACSHDAVPIARGYALQPGPFAIRGRVTTGDPPVALAGATVAITASTPVVALPPATITAADGTYSFPSVPAVRSLTLDVSGHTQTLVPSYPDPVLTVNFAL